MILNPSWIPMQDDPEKAETGVGKLRQDAIADAECRRAPAGADQRVFEGQPWDRIQRAKSGGAVCLDTASSDRARVCQPRQKTAWTDSRLHQQGRRTQSTASDSVSANVSSHGEGRGHGLPTLSVFEKVHGAGCEFVGSSGSGARAAERAGHALHPEAGVRAIR